MGKFGFINTNDIELPPRPPVPEALTTAKNPGREEGFLQKEILQQVNAAVGKAIETELVGYGKPLSKLTEKVVAAHEKELYEIIDGHFATLLTADSFKAAIKDALNERLAKLLIAKMGGELEKQVNGLKSNPATRAKITLAIQRVIEEM